ncbi:hypothetical protein C6P40_002861 [Pichia californica]|uniref:Anaphase spindle elongation protein n=1 Tax=Pichia californica TaxID=460514 RepID=A0A9P6WJ78_9ASCO|nr:hypothetical protein C6P40_002861 [[Candida] californica]
MENPPSIENIDLIQNLSKQDLLKLFQSVLSKKDDDDNNNNNNPNPNNNKIISSSPEKSPSKPQVKEQINHTFQLPIDNIITKLNQIQNSVSLLGNHDKKLNLFYNSLISLSDNFINDLNLEKDKLNNEFIKSLETITKIFSITSKFKPIESINDSVLNPKIKNIIDNYLSNSFKNLDYYCSENLSMYDLNSLIEEDLIRLIPILSQQLLTFNKQLKKFYSLYDLIDDYNPNIIDESFLIKLPTKSDIKLFNEINQATDIKLILQTNFNQINPNLINQLNTQILNLNQFIIIKCNEIKNLIIKITNLNHELFIESDENYLKLSEYLNNYLIKIEQLWSILRPNSNEIQSFLKINKNLYLNSFKNFDNLLNELEIEKLNHIKEFIYDSREKIIEFWNLLMYDDESKKNFKDFYINDESKFNEKLLDSHTIQVDKLRNEVENLKPLLNLISNLNELIELKKDLDESSKNPSRLLKRNSFNILKQEEKSRNKLSKQFPLIINQLRSKIKEFEIINKRDFKLNGERYLDKLIEIEDFFIHSRRNNRSSSSSSSYNKLTSSSSIKRTKSNINKKNIKNVQTPLHSIIKKRNPDQMTNPFLSRDPTPLRNKNSSPTIPLTTLSIISSSSTSSPNKASILSTEPIILRGRSPVKNKLNLNASTLISNVKPIISPNFKKIPFRSPMTKINRNNQNNIPINIQTTKKLNSIPVEELSDSFLDYSDNDENINPNNNSKNNNIESQFKVNKENNQNPVTLSTIKNSLGDQTNHFNLSLDSETF